MWNKKEENHNQIYGVRIKKQSYKIQALYQKTFILFFSNAFIVYRILLTNNSCNNYPQKEKKLL